MGRIEDRIKEVNAANGSAQQCVKEGLSREEAFDFISECHSLKPKDINEILDRYSFNKKPQKIKPTSTNKKSGKGWLIALGIIAATALIGELIYYNRPQKSPQLNPQQEISQQGYVQPAQQSPIAEQTSQPQNLETITSNEIIIDENQWGRTGNLEFMVKDKGLAWFDMPEEYIPILLLDLEIRSVISNTTCDLRNVKIITSNGQDVNARIGDMFWYQYSQKDRTYRLNEGILNFNESYFEQEIKIPFVVSGLGGQGIQLSLDYGTDINKDKVRIRLGSLPEKLNNRSKKGAY